MGVRSTENLSDIQRWAFEKRQEVVAGQMLYTKKQYTATHTADGSNRLVFTANEGGWWFHPHENTRYGFLVYRRYNAQKTPNLIK